MSSETDREQELRRLLAEAVDPVQPASGAQTRLIARARAQQRRRQRPLMARLGVPAAVVSFLVVVVLAVVFVRHEAHRSNGSSAASTAGGALPSRAAESSSAASAPEGAGLASPAVPMPMPSEEKGVSGTSAGKGTSDSQLSTAEPYDAALAPSDLDGDGAADTFTLGAGTLVGQLSRDGLEAVSLPPLGPGARVLRVTSLTDVAGAPVRVVFVRLRQAGATSTDTVAALVDGHLTVLQKGSGPVLLTIDASHGYACNQGALAQSGNITPFVVEGAQLVPSPQLRGVAVKAGTAGAGCGF